MLSELARLATPETALALLIGYLCGSIPFGLILTRLAGTADIRTIGSKNIGATNVLRTGRKDLAIATLLLDALKGTVAVLIAWRWGEGAAAIAGLGAFLGHCFPIWLKFEGGKGVATFIGVLLALWWPGVVLFAAIWLSIAYLTRYSSLAALVASALVPLVRVVFDMLSGQGVLGAALVVMAIILWWKHGPNIARLRAGTEGRIGEKAAPKPEDA
ncbi:MAG: glycerol-3-phosphate 1-O-acyltransferase PlsY [Proteobacteria bacterium]|nr:glycerol-3-phosphate 1-O-acyltransferase PlsY [Pseudomonadota bacterium]